MYLCEGVYTVGLLDATYRVLVRERKKLLLEIGAARTWVSVDRLKLHMGAKTPAEALRPRASPEAIL